MLDGPIVIAPRPPYLSHVSSVSSVSYGQWFEDLRSAGSLELYQRTRGILRETKQYVFREVNLRWYLRRHPIRKLQLGAGENLFDGWLNTDLAPISKRVAFLDARRPFPIDDGSFDYVFSEHHLEHLTYSEGQVTLAEVFRVLRPGGRVRIATPDLARLLALYQPKERRSAIEQRYIEWIAAKFLPGLPATAALVINNNMRFTGHQFLYDEETLRVALARAGFTEIVRREPGESADPHLHRLEAHGRLIQDEEINRFETMVIEGTRP